MRIAHLIMAHQDPEHVNRLASRLSSFSDVYIHIDRKANLEQFQKLNHIKNVHYLTNRIEIEWGGWNSVAAEVNLLKAALEQGAYDRLIFLQGADYPIKSNEEIRQFFEARPDIEFIRGCNCTQSKEYYFRLRCYSYWMRNHLRGYSLMKRAWNRITNDLRIEIRDGYASGDGVRHEVFWGSAQWAITGRCAAYIVDFYDHHPHYNRWYYHCFPADELYFTTLIMNSGFAEKTTFGGPEKEVMGLVNWRNLHYFEYIPGQIRVFTDHDYDEIKNRDELYVRKVNTRDSRQLLNLLDKDSLRLSADHSSQLSR